ncbi:spondin-1-like isoform X2 [Lethenteron reissneri]|uniref:spondin-1-like isoform X2 n=1 Tax=Lethenteron reissneri TaxID=7753 RepID=UPI002AB6CBBC|nr:spondin-1-like isoform X2 [Lethenteron reissneri]
MKIRAEPPASSSNPSSKREREREDFVCDKPIRRWCRAAGAGAGVTCWGAVASRSISTLRSRASAVEDRTLRGWPSEMPLLALLLWALGGVERARGDGGDPCHAGPARYVLTFHAEWNVRAFPKQYPLTRPPAQWSALIGVVHSSTFSLWSEGAFSSPAFKTFVEQGDYRLLRSQVEALMSRADSGSAGAGSSPVLSWFSVPALRAGVGNSTTSFHIDAQHPMVSIVVRLIPSPDWFVGVSSLDLCSDAGDGGWTPLVSHDLQPWDGGTDSGFAFSSPNYASEPQEPISLITAQRPSHPANSFHYPRLQALPRIGFLEFHLQPADHDSKDSTSDLQKQEQNENGTMDEMTPNENSIQQNSSKHPHGIASQLFNAIKTVIQNSGQREEAAGTPLDCEVSDWAAWGLCSRTCSIGVKRSTRFVIQTPANGGRPCPELHMEEACVEQACASVTYNPVTCAGGRTCVETATVADTGNSSVASAAIETAEPESANTPNSMAPVLGNREMATSDMKPTSSSAMAAGKKTAVVPRPEKTTHSAGTNLRSPVLQTQRPHVVDFDHGFAIDLEPTQVEPTRSSIVWSTPTSETKISDPDDDPELQQSLRLSPSAFTAMPALNVKPPPRRPAEASTQGAAAVAKHAKAADGDRDADGVPAGSKGDCAVSPLSPAGPCSRSCGFGLQRMSRTVLRPSRGGGRPCPELFAYDVCLVRVC